MKVRLQKVLYVLSEKAISLEKERDGFAEDSLVHIIKTEDDQMKLLRKVLCILDEFMKIRMMDSENDRKPERKKRLPDRTEEYSSKWNENMFLNDFDEDDDDSDDDDSDDDDMITDIGDMEFSTEVPAGGADSSFDVSSIRNIKLDIDAAEITVKEPDDSTKIRAVLKHGKEKYYSCRLDGDTIKN